MATAMHLPLFVHSVLRLQSASVCTLHQLDFSFTSEHMPLSAQNLLLVQCSGFVGPQVPSAPIPQSPFVAQSPFGQSASVFLQLASADIPTSTNSDQAKKRFIVAEEQRRCDSQSHSMLRARGCGPSERAAELCSRFMHTSYRIVFTAMFLLGCDKPKTTAASSTASPTLAPSPSSTATASASAASKPVVPASATASASAAPSASGAAASPCPEGARKDDDARYCILLPKKKLAVSYEGDKPSKGIREELEIAGDRVVITIDPAPAGKTVAQLKADALTRIGSELVESGDLSRGYWTDLKDKNGQHIVEGVVVSKYVISCMHWVRDEKNLPAARAVCQSLTTF
jgi:hypothetical protein